VKRVGITETPTLSPDGQEEIDELSAQTLVRQWNGAYPQLKAMKPVPGSLTKDGFTVIKANLKSKPGGQGLLTVTVSKAVLRAAPGLSAGPMKTTYAINWERTQRPLRQHPLWATIDATTWAGVDAWENEDDWALKEAYQYRVPSRSLSGTWEHDENGQPVYEIRDVSGSVHDFCDLRLKGIDSFDDFHPVVKRTRIYRYEPTTGGCGLIEESPKPMSGYTWLKTGDDASDQGGRGMWTRVETWEGYKSIETTLYTPAPASLRKAPAARKKGLKRA
jgi:hypothetical protein